MVRRWTAKSPEWTPPGPGLSRGIYKRMLMKFVLTGAVPGAWGGRAGKAKSKTLPAAPQVTKTWLPRQNFLLGLHAKFNGGGWGGWLWPRTAKKNFKKVSMAPTTASPAPLILQGFLA
eukprot:1158645-Pelagomonas_calceolata.AAC.10